MEVNGIPFDFDFADADDLERLEAALQAVQQEAEAIRGKSGPAGIRAQCQIVFEFFDSVFGPGSAKRVFGDRCNLIQCLDAFEAVVRQEQESARALRQRMSRYLPAEDGAGGDA